MLWEMVHRDSLGVPMRSVLFSASVNIAFPAALTARKVRKTMPGMSEMSQGCICVLGSDTVIASEG